MNHLIGSNEWTNSGISMVFRLLSYSTKTSPSKKLPDTLPIRVSRTADPKASILPILNQWLQEGKPIKHSLLQNLVRQLRRFRSYNHALQVSEYMSEEMKYDISIGDMAIRLDLISKVRGIDEAEKYFDSLAETKKTFQVYGALLNCYAHHKCLEKAEATMQNMRESGFTINVVSYNVMLNLYRLLGKYEKLDVLKKEMKEKGIMPDSFTNNIRLNAYASSSDTKGMEKFLAKIENESSIDWNAYVVVANAYLKAGITEKALQMLNRVEQLVTPETRGHTYEMFLPMYANLGSKDEVYPIADKEKRHAYEVFLALYANIGSKKDVYRIWNLRKYMGKLQSETYLFMISSLVKLDDIDSAEKIAEEWESQYTDVGVPRLMISAYCKKGLLEKAEAYVKRLMESGKELDAFIWSSLATACKKVDQMEKAVENMKKALSTGPPGWKSNPATLAACFDYLKREGGIEVAEELVNLLRIKSRLSTVICDRLLNNVRDIGSGARAIDVIRGVDENLDDKEV